LEVRIEAVRRFLAEVGAKDSRVVPISDPFGPAIVDADLDCIVVSEETVVGGEAVNERRLASGLSSLQIRIVPLIDGVHCAADETKLSSSALRVHSLGTLRKQPIPKTTKSPYVIGLTGGIASGKSNVCRELQTLGAVIVDCDRLAHSLYAKGSQLAGNIAEAFGPEVIREDGEVDRSRLGQLVFSDRSQLDKLNGLVWPMMEAEMRQMIATNDAPVMVLDAAVLIEAGWDRMANEIWLCIVPREEASRRMQERNKLTAEQAEKRLQSQPTNEERLGSAHVVFCSLWTYEETRSQVQRAWKSLMDRINPPK